MLLLFAGIIFVGHLTTFVLILTGQPPWLDWTCLAVQLVLVVMVLVASRRHGFLPANAAERQLWSIWIGYLVAYGSPRREPPADLVAGSRSGARSANGGYHSSSTPRRRS